MLGSAYRPGEPYAKANSMLTLTESQINEYLHRSYAAVDGLWFMMAEERDGFDAALELDRRVWEVLPKIQARKLRELAHVEPGIQGLKQCLETKLTLDRFEFTTENSNPDHEFTLLIQKCPWHDLMVQSNRQHLSGRVGDAICPTEYRAWAREFGPDIHFHLGHRLCHGAKHCRLFFTKNHEPASTFHG